jgi:hypothetical protein
MIEQIIGTLKIELSEKFTKEFGIAEEQTEPALSLAQKNIIEAIKEEVSRGNFNGLFSLLQEKEGVSSNPIVKHMIRKYSADLGLKLGLDPSVADKLATFTIPFILHKFQHLSQEQGLDLTALMAMLNPSGGGNDDNKGQFGGSLDNLIK